MGVGLLEVNLPPVKLWKQREGCERCLPLPLPASPSLSPSTHQPPLATNRHKTRCTVCTKDLEMFGLFAQECV